MAPISIVLLITLESLQGLVHTCAVLIMQSKEYPVTKAEWRHAEYFGKRQHLSKARYFGVGKRELSNQKHHFHPGPAHPILRNLQPQAGALVSGHSPPLPP